MSDDSKAEKKPKPVGYWFEVKTIKGRKYVYKRWREGGHTRSKYMGKVTKK